LIIIGIKGRLLNVGVHILTNGNFLVDDVSICCGIEFFFLSVFFCFPIVIQLNKYT
jgi:hypothetical protein